VDLVQVKRDKEEASPAADGLIDFWILFKKCNLDNLCCYCVKLTRFRTSIGKIIIVRICTYVLSGGEGLRTNSFKCLLAVLLLVSLVSPLFIVAAEPLGPNPGWVHWPAGTIWGAQLVLENNASGDVFFGATTGAEHTFLAAPTPPSPPYIWEVLRQGTTDYGEITRTEPAAPQSYTWYVKMYYKSDLGDNVDAKIWAVLENEDTLFIPQDYSVILENAAKSIGPFNLRKENGSINLVDGAAIKYATLYVDNAVNIQSIDNLDPLTGPAGDNLRLRVTVKNTGRYTDNYVISTGGSLDPTILNLAPGNTDNVIVTTKLPAGTQNIVITAAGNYATDQDYVVATGLVVRKVEIKIAPNENFGENGATLTFDVLVKNIGNLPDNYNLTASDNAGWGPTLDNLMLGPIQPGENRTTTLRVTIPDNAIPGARDNLTVTATSGENAAVENNASCIAGAGFYSVNISILPSYQENFPGGMLNYTITILNTGTLNDSYTLTPSDNTDGNNYWEDNILLDNLSLSVPAGENRTTMLRVTIPDNSTPGTDDNITVTATSQSNNTVKNFANCIAHVAIVRIVQVSIDPQFQENENGGTLKYDVMVKNLGDVQENFQLTKGDTDSWTLGLDNDWLLVPNGENRATKLTVIIPDNAASGTLDNVWVQATSKDNAAISDNESCLAQVAILRGVQVVIDPSPPKYLENENGGTLKFSVTVVNLGKVQENFQLTKGDNTGWTLSLDNNWLSVPDGENRATKLNVVLPNNGAQVNLIAGWNLVSFTATSDGDTPANLFAGQSYYIWRWDAENKKYVLPHSDKPVELGVGYWIWVGYDQTITTSGVPVDTYSENLKSGWNLVGFPVTSDNTTPANLFPGQTYYIWKWDAVNKKYVNPLSNNPVELGVGYWIWINQDKTITGSAIVPTWDNIWVKATSKDDPTVFDNESCLAHIKVVVVIRGVQTLITPTTQYAENGGVLAYAITLINLGNAQENFQLTKGDNTGWTLSLDNTWLLIPNGENRATKLTVNIPTNATGGTWDNIWVQATSKDNENVWDNRSCIAQVTILRGVQVVINPSPPAYLENENGGTVKFSVTIVNPGNVQENFQLTKGDNAGWTLNLDDDWLLVPKDETGTTTLTVTIPTNAIGGTWDNIWVQATSKDNVTVFDNESCLAHVKIVIVEIMPPTQENNNGGTLKYDVTVKNLAGTPENFLLTKGDTDGWTLNLDNNWLLVSNSDSRTTKLNVAIPPNAVGSTLDSIWVQATSKDNVAVFDNKSCLGQVAIARGVEVQITPKILENARRENITFSITIINTGNVTDSFDVSWSDTENWGDNISLLESILQISGDSEGTTILSVHIPDNASPNTEDNITVTAVSQTSSAINDSDICMVHVIIARKVNVSISPAENSAILGETLTFTVAVTNNGDNADNYVLQASDNLSWNLSLAENSLENVLPGSTRMIALTVAIPENATPNTQDNIIVTATSRDNENFTGNASCVARSIAIQRSVSVSISPTEVDGMPGDTPSFTIKVTNTGNIIDNYDLTFSDNAGWNPSISADTLEVQAGENLRVTLSVTVPDNAIPDTRDKITITVTSREDAAVSNSATCLARALILRRVEVTISPDYRNGPAGAMLNYTVRVTNTGRAADNYRLVISGTSGWLTSIVPNSLSLGPGESGEATLTITVPSGSNGSSMIFYVWAISSIDSTVRANATCRALALVIGEGGGLSIPWLQIIIIAAIIIAAVFTVGYLTRRRERRGNRRVLKGVSAWPLMS
jgi:uncharacterized repeat protein (TIGR01451 family)